MRAWLLVLLVAGVASVGRVASAAHTPAGHNFGFDDMAHLKRLGGFDVARDGKSIVYAVTSADADENKTTSALFWQSLDGKSAARQLTAGTKKDRDPRLSPDGTRVAFVSDRDGAPQVYLLDLGGGEPRKLTSLPLGVDGPIWSPDGTFLVAAAEVFADCKDPKDLACDRQRAEREEKAKVKARVVERLLFRHWDGWRDGKRSHLFRIDARSGEARDLTPGNFDAPPFSLGGGGYDIAPDGKTLVYASNHDKDEATSTNGDIWELAFADGAKARCLSCANHAFDGDPHYSPDGKRIAWTAQTQPGFESDRFDLVIYDRAAQTSKAAGLAVGRLDRGAGLDGGWQARRLRLGASRPQAHLRHGSRRQGHDAA